jgi:hypothetical protein
MQSQKRRLKTIELDLSPQQVVVLWLRNALQAGTFEEGAPLADLLTTCLAQSNFMKPTKWACFLHYFTAARTFYANQHNRWWGLDTPPPANARQFSESDSRVRCQL